METAHRNDFRTFIRIHSVFKSERLSANTKITLHKALIRSVIIYACRVWELAADTFLLKFQRMQNKVLRTIGNFPRCILVRDLHIAFNIPYVYDYVLWKKLCRKHAQVTQNHENEHVRGIGQGEARHRKYKRLKLAGGLLTTVQMTKLPL
jgi:hypothetical protein